MRISLLKELAFKGRKEAGTQKKRGVCPAPDPKDSAHKHLCLTAAFEAGFEAHVLISSAAGKGNVNHGVGCLLRHCEVSTRGCAVGALPSQTPPATQHGALVCPEGRPSLIHRKVPCRLVAALSQRSGPP